MTADDDRRQLTATATALVDEVSGVNKRLDESNKQVGKLAKSNEELSRRAHKHSWWIVGVVAGLVLDVLLTIVLFGQNSEQKAINARQEATDARQEATQTRLEVSVRNQCGLLALIIGSYRPESRPPDGRAEYEESFRLMREEYKDLACSTVAGLVPPAIQPGAPRPHALGPLDDTLITLVPVAVSTPLPQRSTPSARRASSRTTTTTGRRPMTTRKPAKSSGLVGSVIKALPKPKAEVKTEVKLGRGKAKAEGNVKLGPVKAKVHVP